MHTKIVGGVKMSEKQKKMQVAKISVFITSIFVIFLSVSYAFINLTLQGTKKQVITAGNLELDLIEDENNISISNALPMYDDVGMIQDAFTFRLINNGNDSVGYRLKLVDITTGDKLSKGIVKYGLTKEGTDTINFLSTLSSGVIDEGVINGKETINYKLRLWIDSNVTDNNKISGKSLKYRIEVEAGQLEETKYYGMIQKADWNSTEAFWQYREQITSIAFDPAINIPDNLAIPAWDVSHMKDKSVMAYIEDDGTGNDTYKLHIQAKDKIYTNQDSSYLFNGFKNLTKITGMGYVDTSKTTSMYSMFNGCSSLTSLDVSSFDTSNVTDMGSMFSGCSSLTSLDLSHFDTSNVTTMGSMFSNCSSLTNLDLSNFDTSNVTNMRSMFWECSSLTNLDLSNFDTSNVTNMYSTFSGCSSLTRLDVSNLDTSKVTDMSNMFWNCSSLTSLDASHFDTSNVADIHGMFFNCSSLTSLDVSYFDTSNVTNMSYMFRGCSNLTNLDVSNFDTSKVTNMSLIFAECSNLTSLNLSNFDTSTVTNMSYMFDECGGLTNLDLSNFDTSNVTNMSLMFEQCSNLTNLDLSNMDFSSVTSYTYMFSSVQPSCSITVKDETAKTWITSKFTNLTNVQVKSA